MHEEGKPHPSEMGFEIIPTEAEVRELFLELVEGKSFVEVRKLEDDKGIYLWDIEVHEEAETKEYSYVRKGSHANPPGKIVQTAIHFTSYTDGMPTAGQSVRELRESGWTTIPLKTLSSQT